MTREEKEQTGKYVLQMARLLEDGCYQQEMLLKAVHIIDETLEQESCEDAISRQEAIDAINTAWTIDDLDNLTNAMVIDMIKALPSVNSQPKTGYWTRELIRNEKGGCIGAKMICSECGNDNKHDEYMNYCPNCGVKMVESQERSGEE